MPMSDKPGRRSTLFDPKRPLSGRLPPLHMLRAFEAAGRTGSMRKAASDIGISHTVVSRHIKNLEAWIGWELLSAGPRGIQLTSEGQSLYQAASSAFQSIANNAAQLRSKAGRDELRIWCAPGLATRWLIPRLQEIRDAISSGEVLVRAADRMPDFSRNEADLMIGFGDFSRLPEHAIPLLQPRMFPVASPSWLMRNGLPATPQELTHMLLIHEESYDQWTRWFEQAGVVLTGELAGPRLWDASLGFDAALAGQGVALTSNLMVSLDIEEGRLVELLDTNIFVGGYFLLVASSSSHDERVSLFRSWIERTIEGG